MNSRKYTTEVERVPGIIPILEYYRKIMSFQNKQWILIF